MSVAVGTVRPMDRRATDQRSARGRAGEDAALGVYERRGFALVARNWRCPLGELDDVAGEHVALTEDLARRTLRDPDEYVRAWAIQLVCGPAFRLPSGVRHAHIPAWLEKELVRMGTSDPSPVVRLYLASAMQRAPDKTAWQLAGSWRNTAKIATTATCRI